MTETKMTSSERRAHARFPLSGRAQVEFEERRYFLTENVVAASAGGFFVQSEQPAKTGERISFDLRVTGEGPVFSGTGEVSWVREDSDSPDEPLPTGFGVKFIGLEPQGSQLLLDLSDAYAEGGEGALNERLETAVEAWKEGGETGEAPADLEDTETLLKETTEMQPIHLEEADTDPMILSPENVIAPEDLPEAAGVAESELDGRSEDYDEGETLEMEPAGAGASDSQGTTPSQGLTLEDRDVLSKTLDVGGARSVAALRGQDSHHRKPVPIWPVLLTAGLLVGGLLWMTSAPSDPPTPVALSEAAAVPGEGPAAPFDPSEPTLGADSTLDTEAAATGGPSAGAEDAFRGIREIRWKQEGSGLRVVIEFDGRLAEDGFKVFRPGTDPPREVVQVFGVRDHYPTKDYSVGTPELQSIRIGHHETDAGLEDRIVLDLPNASVRLLSVEPHSASLHLFLEAETTPGTPGPN